MKGTLDHFAPESEFCPSGRFVDSEQVYRGREGYADFRVTFRSAWETITISIERIEDLDDQVLALARSTGKDVEAVWRSAGGREDLDDPAWLHPAHRDAPERAEALEAAGLTE